MFRTTSFFLLVLLISGCGSSNSLEPLPTNAVILAFGDSLTFGTGVSPKDSYPSVLQKLTDRKVINAGVPGEITEDGYARLLGLINEHKPNMLIIIHGGNDMLKKLDLAAAKKNITAMILLARKHNIDVIMLAVPNPTLILSPAGFYEEVADELGVPIEVDAISDILQYPGNKSDAVHPNEKGYKLMAQHIQELLISAGAL